MTGQLNYTLPHALCIIHLDPQVRDQFIATQLSQKKIHPIDQFFLNENTITIALIRSLIGKLARKPFVSGAKAAVIAGDYLTPEAQQALLKTLEEPPRNTFIYLSVTTGSMLLPTIESRCQMIRLTSPFESLLTSDELHEMTLFWTKVFRVPLGERLKQSGVFHFDTGEFKTWLTKQIHFFRCELYASILERSRLEISPQVVRTILDKLLTAWSLTRNNISPRLALDMIFLSLPFTSKLKEKSP